MTRTTIDCPHRVPPTEGALQANSTGSSRRGDWAAFSGLDAYLHYLIETGAARTTAEARRIAAERIPLESAVQKEVLQTLRKHGGFWWKDAAGPYQQQGIPDIIGCYRGHFVGIEVKRPLLGKATPMQQKTMDAIKAAGGYAYIATSARDAEILLALLDAFEEDE